jgi:hypothetical protein
MHDASRETSPEVVEGMMARQAVRDVNRFIGVWRQKLLVLEVAASRSGGADFEQLEDVQKLIEDRVADFEAQCAYLPENVRGHAYVMFSRSGFSDLRGQLQRLREANGARSNGPPAWPILRSHHGLAAGDGDG